jgi:hypothetical protein
VGHDGPYCALCSSGYARSAAGGCSRCNAHTTIISPAILGGTLLLTLAVAIAYYLRRLRDTEDLRSKMERVKFAGDIADFGGRLVSALARLKLLVVHVQVNTALSSIIRIRLPRSFTRFLGAMGVINLDVRILCFAAIYAHPCIVLCTAFCVRHQVTWCAS